MKPNQINGIERKLEQDLLLSLVRPNVNEEVQARIQALLQQSPDWDYLLQIAYQHRVTPLLHDNLKPVSDCLPQPFWSKLKQRRRQISEANFALTSKLLKFIELLQDHGVSAIAYKGPALAQSAYGDIGLRHFIDLDILVHKRDIQKTKEVLLANGCEPAWRLTAAQEAAVLRYYYEYPFFCNDRKVMVEVHWDFAEPFFSFALNCDEIWERLETIKLLGNPINTLGPEDFLLLLCAHGAKHCWQRLGWVCDVAQLVSRRTDLNWELLFERATALGLQRMVWVGLCLANDTLGLKLPADVVKEMRLRPQVAWLSGQMQLGLFSKAARPSGTIKMTRLQMKLRERPRDRLGYCFRLIVMTKLVDSLFMPMGRPR